MYRLVVRPLLFLLPPETAHAAAMFLLSIVVKLPGGKKILTCLYAYSHISLERKIAGLYFRNPLGLAAGFDKNARWVEVFEALGFGHIEIGTVTPRPQAGNLRPRLFRLSADKALINRMGFNNDGLDKVVRNLQKLGKRKIIIGGNIGKNKTTPNEKALEDYRLCFEKLYPWVDYFTVNISSPNTPGLRDLQNVHFIKSLLKMYYELPCHAEFPKPVFIKLSPDLSEQEYTEIAKACIEAKAAGLVISNTTITRHNLSCTPQKLKKIGEGGLSGKPLQSLADAMLSAISKQAGDHLILIGVGGIFTPDDACQKMKQGASLIQIYTGFIYEGPSIVRKILKALV